MHNQEYMTKVSKNSKNSFWKKKNDFGVSNNIHLPLALSDQGTFTLVGAQRGVPWDPPKKTTFPLEFCIEIWTINVCTVKNHNSGEKINMLYRFKMVAN